VGRLTYGRDQAAKMLQAHKEAKKKGERMIDKTLKGTLKSVKELGKMAANVTELAVETTAKSLNVMEKAAMEAAEKTIERSKEMARLVRPCPHLTASQQMSCR
jgi:RNA polymerase-interacting CarD/CdnL/TRCF family regulator